MSIKTITFFSIQEANKYKKASYLEFITDDKGLFYYGTKSGYYKEFDYAAIKKMLGSQALDHIPTASSTTSGLLLNTDWIKFNDAYNFISSIDTDSVPEGSTNLYFTEIKARNAVIEGGVGVINQIAYFYSNDKISNSSLITFDVVNSKLTNSAYNYFSGNIGIGHTNSYIGNTDTFTKLRIRKSSTVGTLDIWADSTQTFLGYGLKTNSNNNEFAVITSNTWGWAWKYTPSTTSTNASLKLIRWNGVSGSGITATGIEQAVFLGDGSITFPNLRRLAITSYTIGINNSTGKYGVFPSSGSSFAPFVISTSGSMNRNHGAIGEFLSNDSTLGVSIYDATLPKSSLLLMTSNGTSGEIPVIMLYPGVGNSITNRGAGVMIGHPYGAVGIGETSYSSVQGSTGYKFSVAGISGLTGLFKVRNSSGTIFFDIVDGTNAMTIGNDTCQINIKGDVGINGTNFGSGSKVIFVSNAATNPSTNPSGGFILYGDSGAAKIRGSSGTITTIAPAHPHCPICDSDFVIEYESEKYGYLAVCIKCLTKHINEPYIMRQKNYTT